MYKYQVVVGNIGTVYDGDNKKKAYTLFKEYCSLSKDNYGRAAGEDVALFEDGHLEEDFLGSISDSNSESMEIENIFRTIEEKGIDIFYLDSVDLKCPSSVREKFSPISEDLEC